MMSMLDMNDFRAFLGVYSHSSAAIDLGRAHGKASNNRGPLEKNLCKGASCSEGPGWTLALLC